MAEQREVLYAADIAKLLGISPRAARLRLAAREAEPGSGVRRVGNKLCISRKAFDSWMPGGAGVPRASVEEQLKQLDARLQAFGRKTIEHEARIEDLETGVQTARMDIHELREAPKAEKSTHAA
jgi:hypothetical protein